VIEAIVPMVTGDPVAAPDDAGAALVPAVLPLAAGFVLFVAAFLELPHPAATSPATAAKAKIRYAALPICSSPI
jgi:hypothetical protein